MSRYYVDNAMNRRLGRVGMPLGSAVHSRGASYSSGSSFSPSATPSYYGVGTPSHYAVETPRQTTKTYVDNAYNRKLDRVGLPHGAAVQSKVDKDSGSSFSPSATPSYYGVGTPSHYAVETPRQTTKIYVDNAYNRKLDRVSLPHGAAVQSKVDKDSGANDGAKGTTKTYVDNAYNRKQGRVDLPHGSAVHSKDNEDSRNAVMDRADLKVYKDNALNRSLKRVGLPLGSAVHRKGDPIECFGRQIVKVYVDNDFNRKHNRVGLPLGSKPVSKKQPNKKKNEFAEIDENVRAWLQEEHSEGEDVFDALDDETLSHYNLQQPQEFARLTENLNHVVNSINRNMETENYREENDHAVSSESFEILDKECVIPFEDIELGKRIGHGFFGEVFFAKYQGKVVAVKKLQDSNITHKRLRKFEEEIRVHSLLHHANVVRFFGACVERPNLAIVMDYMDGSLWDCIHMEGIAFLPNEKRKIVRDMTSGLEYLHDFPLVHGDLKSQNVLLMNLPDESDSEIVAKLSDFGLSLLKSDSQKSQSSTNIQTVGAVGGTMVYSSPEVLRGERLSDKDRFSADIYSMGVLIWELVCEEVPFEDLSVMQLLKQVGEQGEKPCKPDGVELSQPLQRLLDRCLGFESRTRPNASDLRNRAERIETLVAGEE